MRDDLLQLAESFLKSDSVQNADKGKKAQFLKTKGLNDEEIEEAFKRVGSLDKAPPLPPRPSATQLVYYQTSTPRMTIIQICTFAIVAALGTLSITVISATVIKKIMSRVLNSIANYQANRYRETTRLFEKIDASVIQTNTDPLHDQQIKLNDSLDRLVQLARKVKQDRETPYKELKSNIDGLRNAMLKQPLSSKNNTYGASAYINMYHDKAIPSVPATATKHSVIPAPKGISPSYHPRRKRSFRSELNPLTNPA
ncbi:hypothetical protein EDC94DRAFT_263204 [Helicostylum pulchrum]|nr:hypothetical protein EDC94DRAFT_263204 [Helicostylum pulchrum]